MTSITFPVISSLEVSQGSKPTLTLVRSCLSCDASSDPRALRTSPCLTPLPLMAGPPLGISHFPPGTSDRVFGTTRSWWLPPLPARPSLPTNPVPPSHERCSSTSSGLCFQLCVPLEKAMAPHSSTLAWKIPQTEEPGRLQSMRSQRVRHD